MAQPTAFTAVSQMNSRLSVLMHWLGLRDRIQETFSVGATRQNQNRANKSEMATPLKPFDEIGASHRRAIPITFCKEMKTIQKTKPNEGILVATAFAIWIGLGVSIDDRLIDYSGVWNLSGTLIFFVVGFFVAERPKGSFISRSQILKIASFFLWMGTTHVLLFGENILRTYANSEVTDSTLWLITVISPFIFYYFATFLIRGYHTSPQYQANEEAEQVGDGDAEEAV